MKRFSLTLISIAIFFGTFLAVNTYAAGEITITRVKLDGNKLTVNYSAKQDINLHYPLEVMITNSNGFVQSDDKGPQSLELGDLPAGTGTKTFDITGLRAKAGQQIQVLSLARRRKDNQQVGTASRQSVTAPIERAEAEGSVLNRPVTERARTAGPVAALTEFGEITNLGEYFKQIMRYALPLGVALAILMTIYAGIVFMMSQGEPDKVKEAREIIQGAIVGLLILILSRLLVDFLVVDDPFVAPQAFQFIPHAIAQQAKPSPSIRPFDPDLGFTAARDSLPETRYTSIGAILDDIVSLFNLIVGPLILVGIIITGIMFITAAGDAEKAKKARTSLLWIIVAIAVYLLTFVLLSSLQGFLQRI